MRKESLPFFACIRERAFFLWDRGTGDYWDWGDTQKITQLLGEGDCPKKVEGKAVGGEDREKF